MKRWMKKKEKNEKKNILRVIYEHLLQQGEIGKAMRKIYKSKFNFKILDPFYV